MLGAIIGLIIFQFASLKNAILNSSEFPLYNVKVHNICLHVLLSMLSGAPWLVTRLFALVLLNGYTAVVLGIVYCLRYSTYIMFWE